MEQNNKLKQTEKEETSILQKQVLVHLNKNVDSTSQKDWPMNVKRLVKNSLSELKQAAGEADLYSIAVRSFPGKGN